MKKSVNRTLDSILSTKRTGQIVGITSNTTDLKTKEMVILRINENLLAST